MTSTQIRNQSEPAAPQSRRFSIFDLLALTTAVAIGCSIVVQYPQAFWTTFLTCLWCTLLAKLGKLSHPIWVGFTAGALHASVGYLFFSSSPFLVEVMLIPIVSPLLLLNVWCLSRRDTSRVPQQASSTANVNEQRRKTAMYSLAVLAFTPVCFLEFFLELTPGREFSLIVSCLLAPFAVAPWLVFWRRNQLAGFVFKKNWIDALSRRFAAAAFWIASVSLLPMSAYLIFECCIVNLEDAARLRWQALGYFLLSAVILYLANIIALVLISTSLVVQWYRDRWWKKLNWMTAIYSLVLILMFLVFIGIVYR